MTSLYVSNVFGFRKMWNILSDNKVYLLVHSKKTKGNNFRVFCLKTAMYDYLQFTLIHPTSDMLCVEILPNEILSTLMWYPIDSLPMITINHGLETLLFHFNDFLNLQRIGCSIAVTVGDSRQFLWVNRKFFK